MWARMGPAACDQGGCDLRRRRCTTRPFRRPRRRRPGRAGWRRKGSSARGGADLHNAGSARFVQNNEQMHIGGWENTSAWMSWDFDAPEGDYDVDIVYACDGGNAGSQYVLSVGGNRITAKAADTAAGRVTRPRASAEFAWRRRPDVAPQSHQQVFTTL